MKRKPSPICSRPISGQVGPKVPNIHVGFSKENRKKLKAAVNEKKAKTDSGLVLFLSNRNFSPSTSRRVASRRVVN